MNRSRCLQTPTIARSPAGQRRAAGARALLCLAVSCSLIALPLVSRADELRERQLEADVNRLQRELDAQSRRLDTLERALQNGSASRPTPNVAQHADESPVWLAPKQWDAVRTGMTELDVIAILGRPTSVRLDDDGKVHILFYALELGPNAILAGSVRMNEAGVIDISRPVLR